jgi:surface polysaccharide O-acyltransferase-like enzyme
MALTMNSLPKYERRNDVDWLRIIAMIVIFFFHSARAFDYIPWELKNNELDIGLTMFVIFISAWIMPLFFVLSGMSTFYALEYRSPNMFLKERTKRLMIPYIFGICTVLSIHVYYEALYGKGNVAPFSGNYFEFYFFYFFTKGIYGYGGYFPLGGIYLWYLLFLFLFSLVSLKLFIYLKNENNQQRISKLAEFCNKPGRIFILVIPIIILHIIGTLFIPFYILAGWSFLVHLCVFIYGYIFASNGQFRKAIEKNRLLTLIIGIFLSIIMIYAYFAITDQHIFMILFGILWPINNFCWLITIIGFAQKYLNKENNRLKILNEMVLPFYILHQTIIIMIDYYVIQLDVSVIIKFFIVIPIAFGLTILLVLIVRKILLLRFLFGMRVVQRSNRSINS